MDQENLKSNYQKLLHNYKKAISQNKTLKKKNQILKDQYLYYKNRTFELENEIYEISQLDDDEMTLSQFKARYLKINYDADDMPKRAGIYAYFNTDTKQLYIGQSVNMYNRLKQHFRRGSLKIDGHDSEFSDQSSWEFYVLEYIARDDKKKLDEREAYWIALGKNAVSDKKVYDEEGVNQFIKALNNPDLKTSDIKTSQTIKGKGELTNRTRGNNVRM